MVLKHEFIKGTNSLPFKAFTFQAKKLDRFIPQHWHQSTELLFCLDGKLKIWEQSHYFELKSNDVIIINPNTVHATQSPCPNHVLVIQFPLSFLELNTEAQYDVNFLFNLNTVQTPHQLTENLISCLREVTETIEKKPTSLANRLLENSQVLNLLSLLVTAYTTPVNSLDIEKHNHTIQFLDRVVSYINQHFQSELTLHMIAQEFNYSDSYFSRFFKSNFGMNFHLFLASIRLNHAFEKLIYSNQTLQEISVESGFVTYRNFYNTFIKMYHLSPKAYRTRYQVIND